MCIGSPILSSILDITLFGRLLLKVSNTAPQIGIAETRITSGSRRQFASVWRLRIGNLTPPTTRDMQFVSALREALS